MLFLMRSCETQLCQASFPLPVATTNIFDISGQPIPAALDCIYRHSRAAGMFAPGLLVVAGNYLLFVASFHFFSIVWKRFVFIAILVAFLSAAVSTWFDLGRAPPSCIELCQTLRCMRMLLGDD